jgi:hypothetical protein
MAGNKVSGRHKLPASTILEVIIAMVIMVVVFGIAMMIYTNILRFSLSAKKIRAEAALQDILLQAEQSGIIPSEPIRAGSFSITADSKPVDEEPDLISLHLTAYDDNQENVAEVQEIMINKHENP